MNERILVSRLIEMHPTMVWNDTPITAEMLLLADLSKIPYQSEPYGKYQSENLKSNQWHLGRIKYLAHIGWNDDQYPIEVYGLTEYSPTEGWVVIEDGCHRLMAAVLNGDEYITCSYSGSDFVLDFLKGKTDELPDEIDNADRFDLFADKVKDLIERWSRINIIKRYTADDRIKYFLKEMNQTVHEFGKEVI